MDTDKLKHLTDEQKDRFFKLERLFESPGWALVQEWAQAQRENVTSRLISANTWEQNRLMSGARSAFMLLENLQNATEAEFEALADANESAQLASDEEKFE